MCYNLSKDTSSLEGTKLLLGIALLMVLLFVLPVQCSKTPTLPDHVKVEVVE